MYPEAVYKHFQFKDAVDANYGMHMFPLALEETCETVRGTNLAFQLLLAVTKSNCRLTLFHLYETPERSQRDFRRLFAKFVIKNQIQEGGSAFRTSP